MGKEQAKIVESLNESKAEKKALSTKCASLSSNKLHLETELKAAKEHVKALQAKSEEDSKAMNAKVSNLLEEKKSLADDIDSLKARNAAKEKHYVEQVASLQADNTAYVAEAADLESKLASRKQQEERLSKSHGVEMRRLQSQIEKLQLTMESLREEKEASAANAEKSRKEYDANMQSLKANHESVIEGLQQDFEGKLMSEKEATRKVISQGNEIKNEANSILNKLQASTKQVKELQQGKARLQTVIEELSFENLEIKSKANKSQGNIERLEAQNRVDQAKLRELENSVSLLKDRLRQQSERNTVFTSEYEGKVKPSWKLPLFGF